MTTGSDAFCRRNTTREELIVMKLKKLGAALVIIAAYGAVLASSALAAATTTDVQWYTGASPGTLLSGSETVKAEQVGGGTLVTGTSVVLHTTGVECVNCKIENSGGIAIGSGQLKFTGVTVEKPARCTTSASITTKPLTWQADWMIGTANYWRFAPSNAETVLTFELGGAECSSPGIFSHLGSVFMQTANATGVQAVTQQVNSSPTINSEAGGTTHFGTEPASLTATINFTLSGAKAGTAFGTH
jgi:hypothetical protein